jgi:hypothetical protein
MRDLNSKKVGFSPAALGIRTRDLQRLGKGTDQLCWRSDLVTLESHTLLNLEQRDLQVVSERRCRSLAEPAEAERRRALAR